MINYKICNSCQESKPHTIEFFYKHSANNKLRAVCRTCLNIYQTKPNAKYRKRIRLEVLQHYSNAEIPFCNCCNEAHLEFLAIDHINGGGREHRKSMKASNIYMALRKENLPTGYRVLCHNCNASLGYYGYCPHN